MICGTFGSTEQHLKYIDQVLGKRAGVQGYAAMNCLILADRQLFLADTHVNENPTAEQLAEITLLAAEEMRRFGLEPRAALLSHSNFGSSDHSSAQKMRSEEHTSDLQSLMTTSYAAFCTKKQQKLN